MDLDMMGSFAARMVGRWLWEPLARSACGWSEMRATAGFGGHFRDVPSIAQTDWSRKAGREFIHIAWLADRMGRLREGED
jgi:hypothetical protein